MKSKNIVQLTSLYAAFIFCLLYAASCKDKEKEALFLGTETKPANENFIAGDLCVAEIDAAGIHSSVCAGSGFVTKFDKASPVTCYFVCDFNQKVSWTITIKGRVSGATKIINGVSSGLPFGNTLTKWSGNPSDYRFFESGEICDVTLSFLGSTLVRTTTVKISDGPVGALRYRNVQGFKLLDDFDHPSASSLAYSYTDLGDQDKNKIYLCRTTENIKPVEGNFMLRLTGQDMNANNYLGGTGPELLTSYAPHVKAVVPSSDNNPSNLYVNMYIYGTGLTNTCLQVRMYELDQYIPGTPLPAYTAEQEKENDQWAYDVYVNWKGWKLVSLRYDSFKPSNNPLKGGNGNRVKEPAKITGMNLLLQSLPDPAYNVDAYVDFVSLTWGAPFKP